VRPSTTLAQGVVPHASTDENNQKIAGPPIYLSYKNKHLKNKAQKTQELGFPPHLTEDWRSTGNLLRQYSPTKPQKKRDTSVSLFTRRFRGRFSLKF
jgi:hypothetical protein